MGHVYKAVQWTPFKKRYDVVLAVGVALFLCGFVGAALISPPAAQSGSGVQIALRALGACAFCLLSLILAIGPLARLSPRFLPLLYNRRHLGVTCFGLALAHAALATVWYHGFSDVSPLVSLLSSNPRYESLQGFPFESLGFAALLVLFLLAATSHDFWNANLGPGLWKALHMGVYFAYAALAVHVLLGAVQGEKGWIYPLWIGLNSAALAGLHLWAGYREAPGDKGLSADGEGWIEIGPAMDIPDMRARIVTPPAGERIAVFRDGDRLYALSNRCRHQGGPLGEGRIVDGCVTCPWHGFQYRPQDGQSPPPYAEKVATYRTRIVGGIAFVHARPLPPGTPVAPSLLEQSA